MPNADFYLIMQSRMTPKFQFMQLKSGVTHHPLLECHGVGSLVPGPRKRMDVSIPKRGVMGLFTERFVSEAALAVLKLAAQWRKALGIYAPGALHEA